MGYTLMPTYLYSCTCGKTLETFHSMTATVAIICPDCLLEMTRKPQTTTVTFNGKGWGKDA